MSDCETTENGFNCVSTCESLWFKIWNTTAADIIADICDKEFVGKYVNVMLDWLIDLTIGNMIVREDRMISLGL